MTLYGTKFGTALWLLIGLGTGAFAVSWENQVTGLIAAGWIVLAAFSYLEYRKAD